MIGKTGIKEYLLRNLNTGENEIWIANKNHASYGLKYKNTDLEFCLSCPEYVFGRGYIR